MRLLIVDGKKRMLDYLSEKIFIMGYSCVGVESVASAKTKLRRTHFDLVIAGENIPDAMDVDVISEIRRHCKYKIPILMCRNEPESMCFENARRLGADDGVSTSATSDFLKKRIDCLLFPDLENKIPDGKVLIEGYEFVSGRNLILFADEIFKLTHKEFDVAVCLFRNIGYVATYEEIIEYVWGGDDSVTERNICTYISCIKRKLRINKCSELFIQNVYDVGYKLIKRSR